MEINGDERRQSSDPEAAQSPPAIHVLPVFSDTAASSGSPPAFWMAWELTFAMLAHALRSNREGLNSYYVTILLTFLQTYLQHSEGLATLE
jgi:hypothetical protein